MQEGEVAVGDVVEGEAVAAAEAAELGRLAIVGGEDGGGLQEALVGVVAALAGVGAKKEETVPRPVTPVTREAWRMKATEQAWNS